MTYTHQGYEADATELGYIHGLNGYPYRPEMVTPEDRPEYDKGFGMGDTSFCARCQS